MRCWWIVLPFLWPTAAWAEIEDCRDGNSCWIRTAEYTGEVRLLCAHAPALTAPHGIAARDALRDQIHGTIRVLIDHRDRRGYPVAELVRVEDGYNLGLALVREGWARVPFPECAEAPYLIAEMEARTAGLGIWARDQKGTP